MNSRRWASQTIAAILGAFTLFGEMAEAGVITQTISFRNTTTLSGSLVTPLNGPAIFFTSATPFAFDQSLGTLDAAEITLTFDLSLRATSLVTTGNPLPPFPVSTLTLSGAGTVFSISSFPSFQVALPYRSASCLVVIACRNDLPDIEMDNVTLSETWTGNFAAAIAQDPSLSIEHFGALITNTPAIISTAGLIDIIGSYDISYLYTEPSEENGGPDDEGGSNTHSDLPEPGPLGLLALGLLAICLRPHINVRAEVRSK